jgi:phage baseplate assembly protein W
MAEIVISLPVRLSPYGKIATTSDFSKVWQDKVLQVIGTQIGERVMRPMFGTNIAGELYATSETAEVGIKLEVEQAFAKSLQTLKLTSVNMSFEDSSGALNLEIEYQLPNNKTDSVIVAVGAVSGKKPAAQETL